MYIYIYIYIYTHTCTYIPFAAAPNSGGKNSEVFLGFEPSRSLFLTGEFPSDDGQSPDLPTRDS